jgi:hypothetical protein
MTKTNYLDLVGSGFTIGSDPYYPIIIYYLFKNTLLKRKTKQIFDNMHASWTYWRVFLDENKIV